MAGFDSFFRANYNRPEPVHVWGPLGTIKIMHHRFRGFWWNLHRGQPGIWNIHEIADKSVRAARFRTSQAFEKRENLDSQTRNGGPVLDDPDFTVAAIRLEHHGPSLGYLVREKDRLNVDPARLRAAGYAPGPWIQTMKDHETGFVEIAGTQHEIPRLREQLLVESKGESIAYLTDFLLDTKAKKRLVEWMAGCDVVVCEAQYRHEDHELAERNCHATTKLVAELAAEAKIGQLELFHLSERYEMQDWLAMLTEAREIFPNTCFPGHWNLSR